MGGDQDNKKFCRKFSLTLISAENLPKVRRLFGTTRIQAYVTIGGDKKTKKRTSVDKRNGRNPAWNHRVEYTIDESDVMRHDFSVLIKLYSKRTFATDLYVGEVQTSTKALFDWAGGRSATLAFPVKKGAKNTNGMLNISYSFGERIKKRALWKKVVCCGVGTLVRIAIFQASGVYVAQ